MARTFRRPRQAHPIAELNVTNMIDLGFTLLIIFMTATAVSQQEQTMPLNLPADTKRAQAEPDKDTKFITVAIDNKGAYYLDNAPVTFARLTERLRDIGLQAKSPGKAPVVRIRGDAKVVYEKIVAILDILHQNGLTRISLDTQVKE
ncbi:MAG: biopolymer transporter ExbD [Nibricoccus sp.]